MKQFKCGERPRCPHCGSLQIRYNETRVIEFSVFQYNSLGGILVKDDGDRLSDARPLEPYCWYCCDCEKQWDGFEEGFLGSVETPL